MYRRARRLLTATVLVGSLLTGLAACSLGSGSGAGSGSTAGSVGSHTGATATPGSSGSSSGPGGAVAPGLAAELAQRASRTTATLRSAHVAMTSVVGSTRMSMSGDISYRPVGLDVTATVRVAANGSARTVRVREILAGRTLYLKVPGLAGAKPWRSLSLRQLSQYSGIDLNALLNNSNATPSVRLLTRAADLRLVGTETVGGVRTRHLSGTVDLEAVFDAMPASERAAVATLRDMMDQLGVADMRIELWLNSADVPVKMVQTYRTSVGPARTTMYLTHLNARTSIAAPPRSLVAPLPG